VTTDNDAILWKLAHMIENIVRDRTLHRTVAPYKTQLAVFSNPGQRQGRLAPRHGRGTPHLRGQ